MSQKSLNSYFSTRKRLRPCIEDDDQLNTVKNKVLIIDNDEAQDTDIYPIKKSRFLHFSMDEIGTNSGSGTETEVNEPIRSSAVKKLDFSQNARRIKVSRQRKKLNKVSTGQMDIVSMISSMNKSCSDTKSDDKSKKSHSQNNAFLSSLLKDESSYKELALAVEEFNKEYEKNRSDCLSQKAASDNVSEIKPQIKSFKTIELEISASPQKPKTPEKLYLSPRKSSTSTSDVKRNLIPQFHLTPTKDDLFKLSSNKTIPGLLAEKLLTPEKQLLVLPIKYRILLEIFRALDNICSMFHYRKETITFEKIQKPVEEVTRRTFTLKRLEQIFFIYEEAYSFNRGMIRNSGAHTNELTDQLVITVNFEGDMLTPSIMIKRATIMYERLLEHVKKLHNEFLAALDPPITLDDTKLKQWHAEFRLEQVPDISVREVPKPPVKKTVTARELLIKKPGMFETINAEKIQAALKKLENCSHSQIATSSKLITKQTELEKNVSDKLPKGLLERLRAKQREKMIEKMLRNPQQEKEIEMYLRLPEIARLARLTFVTEKKSTLPITQLVNLMTFSYKELMTETDMQEHLKLLPLFAPQWISFVNVGNVTYVKLDVNTQMSHILLKLHTAIEDKKKQFKII